MTERKKNPKNSSAETKDEDPSICVSCNKSFDDLLDRVMEYDGCAHHFLAECLKISTMVDDYKSQTDGIKYCDPCTTKVKKIIEQVDATTEITKMSDLDKTVFSLKTFRDDFCYFVNET